MEMVKGVSEIEELEKARVKLVIDAQAGLSESERLACLSIAIEQSRESARLRS